MGEQYNLRHYRIRDEEKGRWEGPGEAGWQNFGKELINLSSNMWPPEEEGGLQDTGGGKGGKGPTAAGVPSPAGLPADPCSPASLLRGPAACLLLVWAQGKEQEHGPGPPSLCSHSKSARGDGEQTKHMS